MNFKPTYRLFIRKHFGRYTLVLFALLLISPAFAQVNLQKATITVDFNQPVGNMNPVWAWFGYDEPNYTYMKDGKKLLSEIAALSPVPVFVRAHNLMTTGDGTPALKWGSTNMYTEDAQGNPVYYWNIVDSIFDTYIQRGMKPLAQLGFMPEALSSKPQPYRHHWKPGTPYNEIYTGWTAPPKDYNKWGELVYQWVKHCVQRYGKKEVESWYWELWNEPDSPYWGGMLDEYCKLYDYSVDAVKRALPAAKIGGPHVTGPGGTRGAKFLHGFLKHCISGKNYVTGKTGTPLDFIAFHAKGAPRVVEGHVRMNMGAQLRDIRGGFQIVASYPQLKHLPIIIGESDPEGCAACGMQTNPENAYRNGTMYSSYTAASFARKYALADSLKVNFKGAVSWSFEFEDQPWFFGFRDLATNGVDKPVLNVFRMFGMMQGKRVKVVSDGAYDLSSAVDSSIRGAHADINALASKDARTAAIMIWNYHDDDVKDAAATVELKIKGLPAKKVYLHHYRIDGEHSNSYEVWKKMGSPQNPSEAQIKELEKRGQLALYTSPQWMQTNGETILKIQLPRQAVSLVTFRW
jgi:xylan 1,4-beta-xylosidase